MPQMVQSRLTNTSKLEALFRLQSLNTRHLKKSGFKTKLVFDEKIKAKQENINKTHENKGKKPSTIKIKIKNLRKDK